MSLILSLNLINTASRPMLIYNSQKVRVKALFDTGASTPVWCMGEKRLKDAYPDAEKIKEKCIVGGFGGVLGKCDIFRIPRFVLAKDDQSYTINNLHVAETPIP